MHDLPAAGPSLRTADLGLYRGLRDFTAHNASVPADAGLDVCRCPACKSAPAAGAHMRGPVQCESRLCDPLDAAAMAEIEGRA